jgi:hypothetical protein
VSRIVVFGDCILRETASVSAKRRLNRVNHQENRSVFHTRASATAA